MTTLESSFDQSDPGTQKTSRLAVASLVCSLVFCCPITTVIGPLLGIGGLVQIGRNSALKGRALAWIAIVLGVLFSSVQFMAGKLLNDYIISPMVVGPHDALTAGFDGDITGFKNAFRGTGATASDDEAQAFIDELRRRYGDFLGSELNQQSQPQGGPVMEFEYLVRFENETVDAEVQIIYADEQTGEWPRKLGYITVFDPDLGDLVYPAPAGSDAHATPSTDPASGTDSPGGDPDSIPPDAPADAPATEPDGGG